jgi:hypothetical protein
MLTLGPVSTSAATTYTGIAVRSSMGDGMRSSKTWAGVPLRNTEVVPTEMGPGVVRLGAIN